MAHHGGCNISPGWRHGPKRKQKFLAQCAVVSAFWKPYFGVKRQQRSRVRQLRAHAKTAERDILLVRLGSGPCCGRIDRSLLPCRGHLVARSTRLAALEHLSAARPVADQLSWPPDPL